MKKIKILQAIRQGQFGGGETHVFDLSQSLDPDRFESIVLSFTDGDMVTKLKERGIPVYVIESKFPFDLRTFRKVNKLIHDKKIDLVHAHGTRAASNLIYPSNKSGRPLVYTIHGWSFNNNQSRLIRNIRIKAETWITSQADRNICVSESNLEYGLSHIPRFKGLVIPNGISLNKFDFDLSTEFQLQKNNGEIWIGFIARICYQKDPLTLLRGFKKSLEQNKNLRLLVVGDGDMKAELTQLIKENHLEPITRILPFQRNIPEILKAIDIYCLPSRWEGLPIGLLEAMAMKKSCIASAVDGNVELLSQDAGVLIPKENDSALSEAILDLASNPKKRQKYGEKAFSKIKSDYSLENMVQKIEEVYSYVKI